MSEKDSVPSLQGGVAIASVHETSVAAVAAQAKATVEARYIVAMQRQRDWDTVRDKLLRACKRTRFAETAKYAKPVGGRKIEGASIRFAEEVVRCMGNLDIQTPTIFDDGTKRIVRVSATDLESNATYSVDVTVDKTVERRKLRDGQKAIGHRLNSYGDTVYVVEATDDELLNKTNALISKALRTSALRLCPSDIIEDAMDVVAKTLQNQDKQDPEGARKKIIDAFGEHGVRPEHLRAYLGSDLASLTPSDLSELRSVYTAIREGETSWREVMEQRTAARGGDAVADTAGSSDSGGGHDGAKARGVDAVNDRLKKKREQRKGTEETKAPVAAVPKAALEWVKHLENAPDTDELSAIMRDFGEVADEIGEDANLAVQSAFQQAKARLKGTG